MRLIEVVRDLADLREHTNFPKYGSKTIWSDYWGFEKNLTSQTAKAIEANSLTKTAFIINFLNEWERLFGDVHPSTTRNFEDMRQRYRNQIGI